MVSVVVAAMAAMALGVDPGGFPNSIVGPIRGWRSWNAVFSDVTQEFMTRQVDALVARRHAVGGVGPLTSLLDLGYNRVGIDSGWASCTGVNGSWHDETGHFIINTTKFPSMRAMVDHAHAQGVKIDIYLNQDLDPGWHGCTSEGNIKGAAANTGNFASYKNDADDVAALGYDGVKFDAGGGNDDMNRWAAAINATGREMLLENCNNGGYVPYPIKDAKAPPPPPGGCPFNMFRTGIDNAPSPLSTVSNLVDASRYLNVSVPGCWAYPDMLELGAPVVGPYASRPDPAHPTGRHSTCGAGDGTVGDTAPRLTLEQGMAQFAAWCTVSSPLILGFDLANETEYDRWFPVISNPRALMVQASWAGLAGKMLQAGPPFTTVVPHGASCEDMKDTRQLPSHSVWGKPLVSDEPGVATWAVTAINSVSKATSISLPFSDMGMKGPATVVDVWTGVRTEVKGDAWEVILPPGGHRFVLIETVA